MLRRMIDIMSKVLKILGLVVVGVALVAGGVVAGATIRSRLPFSQVAQTDATGARVPLRQPNNDNTFPFRRGMMGRQNQGRQDQGSQNQGRQTWGGGMMRGYVPDPSLAPAEGQTLTLDQAIKVVDAYLKNYGDSNLEVAEVMQFDNNFYAAIREKDTGIGAFEILIDPETAVVSPEPGANMMWNTKYGMMSGGFGMMGGRARPNASNDMTVTADKARDLAQAVLDKQMPGATVAEDAQAFYGYYTIDILKDGEPAGMLSVNGYTGRVLLHTWHGKFVDMTEEDK
jgi:hypothetical protein